MRLLDALPLRGQPQLRPLRLCDRQRHHPAAGLQGELVAERRGCCTAEVDACSPRAPPPLPRHRVQIAQDGHVGRALAASDVAFRLLRQAKQAGGKDSLLFEVPPRRKEQKRIKRKAPD